MVESMGTASLELARRRGAAPRPLSFGDSVAQAGARRMKENWCGCREWASQAYNIDSLNRLFAIANRNAPGHAPWQEAILLLNHSRGN